MNVLLFICVLQISCIFSYELDTFQVAFHESMQVSCEHDLVFASKNKRWQLAEQLYNQHILNNLNFSEMPSIPLIVHHIWLGSMLPVYAREFRETWIRHNPHWTFILWADHPSDEFGTVVLHSFDALNAYLEQPDHAQFIVMDMRSVRLKNREAFIKQARNWGEKSDIVRYEILYNIGGLYVDTDFECLRSCDDFHYCCDFYTGVSHTKEFVLYNGLIGSAPKNPILLEAIEGLAGRRNRGDSLHYSGPHYFTHCFIKQALIYAGRAVAFPVTFFYPWPHHNRSQSYTQARSWIQPESYAMHYWKVSWVQ